MNRVLAFFGAFNPPTVAHLELARWAMERTGRAGVVFVPSKSTYIHGEQGKDFAFDDALRLTMLKHAAQTRPWMAVSDIELHAPSQPRTYDTLRALRTEGYDPSLLIGSDKLTELEHIWRHVEDIAREFGFVCLSRGDDDAERLLREDPYLRALAPHITLLDSPDTYRDVSSTGVRERLNRLRALRKEVKGMVPEEVWRVLEETLVLNEE